MDFEQEITSKLRADFAKIAQTFPKDSNMLYIRPYVSGTVINVCEFLSKKHGYSYDYFLKLVQPISNKLKKEYFE